MLAFLVLLLNLSTEKASAQEANHGRLSGTVTDMTGAAIGSASVTITNEATGVSLPPITTDSSGLYSTGDVAAGTYTEEVTEGGFKTFIIKGVEVYGGSRIRVSPRLQLGQKTETVTSEWTNPRNPRVEIIGIQNKKIADSSPSVSATISPALGPVKAGSAVKVHIAVENTSDHEIAYENALVMFDVRDENGKLPPETPEGCTFHFFSPCHTDGGMGLPFSGGLIPHKKVEEDEDLTVEYDLSQAGTYTVVGFLCYLVGEGPGCLRTNTIKITVP
jgi:Carboxypeptidase regulatory-like domain